MIRIAITGPESTGKSWLAENLARHYNTVRVPEYARDYLSGLDRQYTSEDVLEIAHGQYRSEELLLKSANQIIFCDTEFIVTKIWSQVKYGKCPGWIEEMAGSHIYDLYLLCNIDIPWQYDPLREHPNLRKSLFEMYEQELSSFNLNFKIISGTGIDRLIQAVREVDQLLMRQ